MKSNTCLRLSKKEYFCSYYTGCTLRYSSFTKEKPFILWMAETSESLSTRISDDLSLGSEAYGTPLLEEGQTLMEIKTVGGLPLWMSHELNQFRVFHTSFSKFVKRNRSYFPCYGDWTDYWNGIPRLCVSMCNPTRLCQCFV